LFNASSGRIRPRGRVLQITLFVDVSAWLLVMQPVKAQYVEAVTLTGARRTRPATVLEGVSARRARA